MGIAGVGVGEQVVEAAPVLGEVDAAPDEGVLGGEETEERDWRRARGSWAALPGRRPTADAGASRRLMRMPMRKTTKDLRCARCNVLGRWWT